MEYETLLVNESPGALTVTFNRLSHRNSLNDTVLQELNKVLDLAEGDPGCRLVILEGQQGVFCTGMDFETVSLQDSRGDTGFEKASASLYMSTISRLALIPKVIISRVDGQVMAGGIGLVAASDLAIATPRSRFSLSEALWGLLPAMVAPYLIRRVGYQTAYRMTLTTLPLSAEEAYAAHLVDEVSEDLGAAARKLQVKLMRLEESTLGNMKRYFRKMWFITEELEELAIAETSRLMSLPRVKENIRNFVEKQQFPWEKNEKN
jgi:polyketide biosynthesis enoyl-CoA hydratase PksH